MRNRSFWIKIRNVGLILFLMNQAVILPSNINSFLEDMFQRNQSSARTHQIWSNFGRAANVRECPDQSCDIVAALPHGTGIRVIGQVQGELIEVSDTWYFIDHDGATGYVFGKLIREINYT